MKNFLSEKRIAAGLTQRQLAQMLNLHYQAIQRWERGENSPSVEIALRIADALNTTVEELFVLDDD